MPALRSILFVAAASPALGHGTVTWPAMRYNPNTPYCPWCQGENMECKNKGVAMACTPPTPCWGAKGPETVSPTKFGYLATKHHPDGSFWVDQEGGSSERPLWCPGETIPFRYYVQADHNGVFHWELQLAVPGSEVEEHFKQISNHTSVNNYNKLVMRPDGTEEKVMLANYFAATDGTQLPGGFCQDGQPWSEKTSDCMNTMFAETTLELPRDLPAGETVLRWRWFGSTNTDGVVVEGNAERSLFVSCKDVIVGTAEECATRGLPVQI